MRQGGRKRESETCVTRRGIQRKGQRLTSAKCREHKHLFLPLHVIQTSLLPLTPQHIPEWCQSFLEVAVGAETGCIGVLLP